MRDPIDLPDPLGSLWLPSDPATVPVWRPGDAPRPELWRITPGSRGQFAKVCTRRLADRQSGQVDVRQLTSIGADDKWVARWAADGLLVPRLPGVYAVGHNAPSVEADMMATLLYAGPGAMLDALVAGWWVGAVRDRPARISISTPRRIASRALPRDEGWLFDAIDIHGRRDLEPIWLPHNADPWRRRPRGGIELPVTPIPQLALDLARVLDDQNMRWTLANLDYRRLSDRRELAYACGRGRPGSTRLQHALDHHQPLLAKAKSRAEARLIFILEEYGVPLPDDANVWVNGIQVDTVWFEQRVMVEIDGEGNHGTPEQKLRDERNDAVLRALGWRVLRYDEDRLLADPAGVAAAIAAHLAARS